MTIDDLWIGDEVTLKATGVKGKFYGKGKSDLYKIQLANGQILEVPVDEIISGDSREEKNNSIKNKSSGNGIQTKKQMYSLDLTEDRKNHEHTLAVAKEYINHLIAKHVTYCKIIFGADTELKSAVAALLRSHREVSIYTPHPNQDAWEVWFDYGDEEE